MNFYPHWLRILRLYHILALTGGVRAFGQEHLKPGPKIIIANHPNGSDYFVLPLVVPDEICYLMEPYLLEWPIAGWIHRATGQIPVRKGQRDEILALARLRIAEGKSIIIMPEGKISPDGGYGRPKVGATLLALQTGVPVVPAGIFVPEKYRRSMKIRFDKKTRVSKWQFFGPAYVKFGEAWHPPTLDLDQFSYERVRQLMDLLMGKAIDLAGQAEVIAATQSPPLFESILSLLWRRGFER
jgi:1-acyl-sn-glycerol-3-phosphate acyltransferase